MDRSSRMSVAPDPVGAPRPRRAHLGLVPRLRLDISWGDLAVGMVACAWAHDVERRTADIESRFGEGGDALVAYSVRSALDAYLSEVTWPAGSEVLVSALTIPHMVRIIAGTLMEVGSGHRAADSMPAIIEARSRDAAGKTAPPQGLTLISVRY